MGQNGNTDQACPVSDAIIAGKDQFGDDFQQLGNRGDIRLRSQDATPLSELAHNRKHNAALPIHTLPAELYLQVIHLDTLCILDSGGYGKGYYGRLIRLSGVCSYWSRVIRDAPSLWAMLNSSVPPKIVEMAFQRSSYHPLDIVFHQAVSRKPPNFQSFMDGISSHRDRCRSIDIQVASRRIRHTIAALGGPAANLEELSLCDTEAMLCDRQFNLFGGRAPLLNSLTLNGVSIRWDSEVLCNLTVLDLSYIHFPSTDAILRALSRSPQLQKLRIHTCSTGSMTSSSSPSVQLLKLVQLEVAFCERAETQNFLDHLICGVKDAA
ncbi:hypothetical protein FRC00_011141 [Tulasnella sp. 408]|nr:hypothetical protein FRC00_011141 [Tulasnella sp. 408]